MDPSAPAPFGAFVDFDGEGVGEEAEVGRLGSLRLGGEPAGVFTDRRQVQLAGGGVDRRPRRRCRRWWSSGLQELVVVVDRRGRPVVAGEASPIGTTAARAVAGGAAGLDDDDVGVDDADRRRRPAAPARMASAGRLRWASSTSTRARVPAWSPSRRRAIVQNASWSTLNAPQARARASAVAPGRAPGLIAQHLQVVVQHQRLATLGRRAGHGRRRRGGRRAPRRSRRRAGPRRGGRRNAPAPSRSICRTHTRDLASTRGVSSSVDVERLDRQRLQASTLRRRSAHRRVNARPAIMAPIVGDVAGGDELVELGERADVRDGDEMAATEPADLALHAALLMGARRRRADRRTSRTRSASAARRTVPTRPGRGP